MAPLMPTPKRPRVAVFELASCAGCQLQILNCEDELVDLLQLVEFAYFKEAMTETSDVYDLALIEGSVTRAADEEKLRTIATARLFLDNFPHIKGHWVMIGEEITSQALSFGLDDLSGTLTEERIAHATTVTTPLGLTQERIRALVASGGRVPVERDTLYRPIDREHLAGSVTP